MLQAVIEGERDGAILRFTKIYDDLALAPDIIRYEGTILGRRRRSGRALDDPGRLIRARS